jgi:hypothetical protein
MKRQICKNKTNLGGNNMMNKKFNKAVDRLNILLKINDKAIQEVTALAADIVGTNGYTESNAGGSLSNPKPLEDEFNNDRFTEVVEKYFQTFDSVMNQFDSIEKQFPDQVSGNNLMQVKMHYLAQRAGLIEALESGVLQ